MHKSLRYFLSFINFLLITDFTSCQEMKYKIVVPGYLCKNNSEENELRIRLMGSDAQKLEYKWAINFKKIGTCRNFQRCTLLAWQSVRNLEKHLQNYPKEQMRDGSIEVNQTMLLPGIEYLLNVSVVINNDIVMDRKQFKIDYVDETVSKPPGKFLGSVNLIAADTTFADAVYFVHAQVLTCTNEENYNLLWQLLDSTGNVIKHFPNKGTELEVAPNTFKAPEKYGIRGKLINSESEETHWVNAMKKGLIVYLPLKNLTVGLGQPVVVNAFIKDPDNTNEELQIRWRVFNKNTGLEHPDVPNENTPTLDIDMGFYEIGIYTIRIDVSKGEEVEEDTCDIEVIEENVPVIEVDEIEDSLSISNEIEIPTTVKQLLAGCVLQWNCVNIDKNEHLDLNNAPGNVNKVQIIEADEDPLLGELQEFSNETLDKQFDLKIAPAQGEWSGLKGDTNYIFRLNVTCPQPLVREGTDNDTEPIIENLNTFAEIKIHTNAPPDLKPLVIKPVQGEALRTNFIFETENASYNVDDLPITYKFGYVLGKTPIIFSNLNYLIKVQTILPFQVNGTQTFMEGCDSKGACKKIFGPVISATLPTTYNKTSLLMEFNNMLSREEYYKAYCYAMVLLKTTSPMQTDLFLEVQNFVMNSTNNEIIRWNNQNVNDESKIIVGELIKNIREFANEFPLPEEVIKNLVTLRDKQVSSNNDRLIFRSRNILATQLLRRKRNRSVLDDFREYLGISELIITKSNDLKRVEQEKTNIIKQFETYMPNLCKMLYKKNQKINLELQTLTLSMVKTSKNLFLNYQTIPFDGNFSLKGKIKLGKKLYEKLTNEKLCVGKASLKNYFGKIGTIFFAKLYGANGETKYAVIENVNPMVILPINQSKAITKSAYCIVWNTNQNEEPCKTLTQTLDALTCLCNNLGYYHVQDKNDELLTTQLKTTSSYYTTSVPTITSKEFSTKNPLIAVTRQNDNSDIFTNTFSYVLISLSVIGSIILCFATKRLITNNRKKTACEVAQFPKYAHFYDEELLENPL